MADDKLVLLNGDDGELALPLARLLLARGAAVAWRPAGDAAPAALPVPEAGERFVQLPPASRQPLPAALAALAGPTGRFGPLAAQVNLYCPGERTDAAELRRHIVDLEEAVQQAAEFMAGQDSAGIVVNQFFCSSLYADGPLASVASQTKNALLGLTRAACVRHGKRGVRVAGVLVGLLDLPGTRALASERVRAVTPPIGRWITVADLAETIAFLALDSGYISGQVLVLDGGLTSGINGV